MYVLKYNLLKYAAVLETTENCYGQNAGLDLLLWFPVHDSVVALILWCYIMYWADIGDSAPNL